MAECARGKEREMTEYRGMADEEERKMIEAGTSSGCNNRTSVTGPVVPGGPGGAREGAGMGPGKIGGEKNEKKKGKRKGEKRKKEKKE